MRSCLFMLFVGILVASENISVAQDADPAKKSATEIGVNDQNAEAEFEALSKQLTNCVFEGHFTIDGQDVPPKKEQYFLKKVKKLSTGDYWLFQTRIKYGDHDVTVPLSLPIKWAGTTPVITVDNVTIPGLGTFNARVLIADGKYSGTWQHGKVGGHLYGTIKTEKQNVENLDSKKEEEVDEEASNDE